MAIMPITSGLSRKEQEELTWIIENQVFPSLAELHGVLPLLDTSSYLKPQAFGTIALPNLIILDMSQIRDMVHGVQVVCHEYCHLLQEARCQRARNGSASRVDLVTLELVELYTTQVEEYYNRQESVEEYLVYWCSPLEIEARAFGQSYGTEHTEHLLESVNPRLLRQVYQDTHNLDHMIWLVGQMVGLEYLGIESLSEELRERLLEIFALEYPIDV